ncbi:hypothetical protein GCM10010518_51440 [Kitasatospora cinereorecta]
MGGGGRSGRAAAGGDAGTGATALGRGLAKDLAALFSGRAQEAQDGDEPAATLRVRR